MLAKKNRLKKDKNFKKVLSRGTFFRSGFLAVKIYPNQQEFSRFGFLVSGKISKKATVRNLITRRLRASVYILLPQVKRGLDCVIFVQPEIKFKGFKEIQAEIKLLFKKAKII